MDLVMGRPWQTHEWMEEGRRAREAWQKMQRWGEEAWPLRDNWPPRISRDKRFGLSQTEAGADRLAEARQRTGLERQVVMAALQRLKGIDYELFRIVASREGMPPFNRLLRGQLAARLRARGNGYSDRRLPSLREMEDIAWVLRTDSRRKNIGFVQARELKPRQRYVMSDDWD